ncbi:unnamed protein product [Effrenium voratum]|nr:unnamed protein product [Effrenium voratum]
MYPAAWFLSGAWLQNKCSTCTLPQLRRERGGTFRLSVRLLGASACLEQPGLLLRQQPCVEVNLGEVTKESEPAEYRALPSFGHEATPPASAQDCQWHFGDTMVFTVPAAELPQARLRFWLRARQDLQLGFLQLDLARSAAIGCCALEVRRRILSACTTKAAHEGASGSLWESQEMVLPLVTPEGAEAEAWLLVSFAVSVDPARLLAAAQTDRSLLDRVSEGCSSLGAAASSAQRNCCAPEPGTPKPERIVVSVPVMEQGTEKADLEASPASSTSEAAPPEPAPEPLPEPRPRLSRPAAPGPWAASPAPPASPAFAAPCHTEWRAGPGPHFQSHVPDWRWQPLGPHGQPMRPVVCIPPYAGYAEFAQHPTQKRSDPQSLASVAWWPATLAWRGQRSMSAAAAEAASLPAPNSQDSANAARASAAAEMGSHPSSKGAELAT